MEVLKYQDSSFQICSKNIFLLFQAVRRISLQINLLFNFSLLHTMPNLQYPIKSF